MHSDWPDTLWIVRHGQSAGNVARDAAESAGLAVIDLAWRDIDVPLSTLGLAQSEALGGWFSRLPIPHSANSCRALRTCAPRKRPALRPNWKGCTR